MPPRSKWESPRGLEDKHTNRVSTGGRPCNTQRCPKSGGNVLQTELTILQQRESATNQIGKEKELTHRKDLRPRKRGKWKHVNFRKNQGNVL